MQDRALIEDTCYYLSPEYADTWWGRYIWLYQGKGRLYLTQASIRLDGKKLLLDVPFEAIIKIDTGEFSRVAKYFRLAFIRLHYRKDGNESTILLVPAKSPFAPTWDTNKVIAAWLEAMRQIEVISSRIILPLNLRVSSPFSRD
ncbi:MAG TPA: hypothetical protein VH394_00480 [Thermoanaerobaculia bacterium]|nr:hypothetical protein [Thermoanaerobaculia bacterium]